MKKQGCYNCRFVVLAGGDLDNINHYPYRCINKKINVYDAKIFVPEGFGEHCSYWASKDTPELKESEVMYF